MADWSELFELGGRQHRAFAIRQVEEVGLSRRTVNARATREGWPRPFRGSIVLPGPELSFETRVSAAILAIGGVVLAARQTAAYLYGLLREEPTTIELVVPYGRNYPDLGPGVRVLRSRTLRRIDRRVVDGIPATTPQRTICDLAAVLPVWRLRSVLIEAKQRRLTDVPQVLRRTAGMRGTKGMPVLRMVARQVDAAGSDSTLAWRARQVLIQAGLRPDRDEHPVTASNGVTVHIDVPFAAYRVGVEAEGLGPHTERVQFEKDLRRRNTLRLTDWLIIWLSWQRLDEDPDGFVEEVRAELIRRGWPGEPTF